MPVFHLRPRSDQTPKGRRPSLPVCVGCGTCFPAAARPTRCPICHDERLALGHRPANWTSREELAALHEARIAELEPGLLAIGMEPTFALGQRALLAGGVLWDCIPLLNREIELTLDALGGLHTIAISHPHAFGAMVAWAERFDARILIHEADRFFVPHATRRIEYWRGECYVINDTTELLRLGGHFPGASVCLWHSGAGGRGALLGSDVLHLAADCESASFVWSHARMVPLPACTVERIARRLAAADFDALYGAWWGRDRLDNAKDVVLRSARRHIAALDGGLAGLEASDQACRAAVS
jgi:hypothetical protein